MKCPECKGKLYLIEYGFMENEINNNGEIKEIGFTRTGDVVIECDICGWGEYVDCFKDSGYEIDWEKEIVYKKEN